MAEMQDQEQRLIDEEIKVLQEIKVEAQTWNNQPYKASIFEDAYAPKQVSEEGIADPNIHRFNHYADKQLQHLVISEQFNFAKIAFMLNYIFANDKVEFCQRSCRQRWTELQALREKVLKVKERKMEDKRIHSIVNMSNPFSNYNLQQMLHKLELTEKQNHRTAGDPKENIEQNSQRIQPQKGYNIFKDSVRKIDNMEEHLKMEQQMKEALKNAQDPRVAVGDKLMHYSPYYERLNKFELKEEELTVEKMKEIMSYQIEMERIDRELKVKDMNEEQYKSKIVTKKMAEGEHFDIEENWDQYESD